MCQSVVMLSVPLSVVSLSHWADLSKMQIHVVCMIQWQLFINYLRRGDALPPWDLRDYISRSRSYSGGNPPNQQFPWQTCYCRIWHDGKLTAKPFQQQCEQHSWFPLITFWHTRFLWFLVEKLEIPGEILETRPSWPEPEAKVLLVWGWTGENMTEIHYLNQRWPPSVMAYLGRQCVKTFWQAAHER